MAADVRNCQNCKQEFGLEPEDFDFYKKIDVPPPTWCPECRLARRLMFRNDRSLYKRRCDLCQNDILAVYSPDAAFPVYCPPCWYGDGWSGFDHGRDYDFSQPFFAQLEVLFRKVPRISVYNLNAVNSPFANGLVDSKNIYLSYSIVKSEDIMFSKSIDTSSRILDSIESVGLEQCYENINCEKNYRSYFLTLSQSCIDSWFLYDCVNCRNCILSSNLRNREYVIRNVQYAKEDYEHMVADMRLDNADTLVTLREEFEGVRRSALHKYADIKKSVDATGHHLTNAKNARRSFQAYDVENVKYCYRMLGMKDMYDVCYGGWSELRYEHITGGNHSYNLKFSIANTENIRNGEYVAFSVSSSDVFGCVGIKNGEYVILNKRYAAEEYKELRMKILAHMESMPYVDAQGRIWKYGEFFPLNFAQPFGYNETNAQELFPCTRSEALARGYAWRDIQPKSHSATKDAAGLPRTIGEVEDAILQEVIGCTHAGECNDQCTVAFRVIPDELRFYRQHNLPLPRLCPNCRHYERLRQMEPLQLWQRPCMCAGAASGKHSNSTDHFHGRESCPNTFHTPYAPGRPETIYCEACYQKEVA